MASARNYMLVLTQYNSKGCKSLLVLSLFTYPPYLSFYCNVFPRMEGTVSFLLDLHTRKLMVRTHLEILGGLPAISVATFMSGYSLGSQNLKRDGVRLSFPFTAFNDVL